MLLAGIMTHGTSVLVRLSLSCGTHSMRRGSSGLGLAGAGGLPRG